MIRGTRQRQADKQHSIFQEPCPHLPRRDHASPQPPWQVDYFQIKSRQTRNCRWLIRAISHHHHPHSALLAQRPLLKRNQPPIHRKICFRHQAPPHIRRHVLYRSVHCAGMHKWLCGADLKNSFSRMNQMWFYRGRLGEHAACCVVFINGGRARSRLPTMGLPEKLSSCG
jgi:hypothetical protein